MLNGIDISNWQVGLRLADIPGVDFMICKATEGVGYVDGTCDVFVQQAKSLNKLWGFYHFARRNSADAEAKFFVDNTINYFGEGIPVLDYEAEAVANGVAWVERFCDLVHQLTGVWPLFYTYQNHLINTDYSNLSKYCGLWVARYANNNPTNFNDYPDINFSLGAYSNAVIWQYSSSGRLAGYNGNLDLNHAYITPEQWQKYAVGDRVAPQPAPAPDPTPQPAPTPTHKPSNSGNSLVWSPDKKSAVVQLWEYNGSEAQQWIPEWISGDTLKLKNVASGLYLDVDGGIGENGRKVQVYTGNDTNAQKWKIRQTNMADYHPDYIRPAEFISMSNEKLVLDNDGGKNINGNKIQIWEAYHNTAQKWSIVDLSNGRWIIVNSGTGKALDVKNGGK